MNIYMPLNKETKPSIQSQKGSTNQTELCMNDLNQVEVIEWRKDLDEEIVFFPGHWSNYWEKVI